ncbi:MAG: helix-turn-helix domain-containing protein [Gammaproteobacteria bacterium]|nr:helix-turn-helix domain-containing protein [Gammaproteobacteria bacterium]
MSKKNQLEELKASVTSTLAEVDTQEISGLDFRDFHCKEISLPGGLSMLDINIDPVIIKRHPNHIAADANYDYFLTTLLEGRAIIQQAEKTTVMNPGDLALMTGGLPYTIEYELPSRRLIARIPYEVFQQRLSDCDEKAIMGHLPNEDLGRVVNDLLKSVAFEAESLNITEQYTLTQSLLELTAALTRAIIRPDDLKSEPRHTDLLNRIFTYIEENYMDSDLTPDKIAQGNGISTRYLHSLFRDSGTTVLKWVWEQRLKAARNDLLDPAQTQTRVSEIAFRRGFNDSAHFSRSFKNRFGISPTQLRNQGPRQADSTAG